MCTVLRHKKSGRKSVSDTDQVNFKHKTRQMQQSDLDRDYRQKQMHSTWNCHIFFQSNPHKYLAIIQISPIPDEQQYCTSESFNWQPHGLWSSRSARWGETIACCADLAQKHILSQLEIVLTQPVLSIH